MPGVVYLSMVVNQVHEDSSHYQQGVRMHEKLLKIVFLCLVATIRSVRQVWLPGTKVVVP